VWDGKKRLDYDPDNQLIAVTFSNAVQSKFVYDGLSRLRIRREYKWQNGAWVQTNEVRYVYDGNLVIQERDSNNVPKVTYTRGLDLSRSLEGAGGIGGLLALTQNGATNQNFYYDNDGAGNITGLFDTNLNQVAYYLYDPFGNTIFAIGPMANVNPSRFSSKEFHSNSGLIYFGLRFYDPSVQRWVNRDPIEEEGGINLYQFVDNNPNGRLDWFGLKGAEDLVSRPSLDDVANKAGKSCNYKSRRENREYCGNICRDNRTGRLFTTQVAGTVDGCNPGNAPCPAGSTPAAVWHTHGGEDPRYDSENFSDADRNYADRLHLPIYVRTPGFHTRKYTPGAGEVRIE